MLEVTGPSDTKLPPKMEAACAHVLLDMLYIRIPKNGLRVLGNQQISTKLT